MKFFEYAVKSGDWKNVYSFRVNGSMQLKVIITGFGSKPFCIEVISRHISLINLVQIDRSHIPCRITQRPLFHPGFFKSALQFFILALAWD